MKKILIFTLLIVLCGCTDVAIKNDVNSNVNAEPAVNTNETTNLANPASTNCINNGGKLEIKEGPNGQYGDCIFDDGTRCEEWAFYRGECQKGNQDANAPTGPVNLSIENMAFNPATLTLKLNVNTNVTWTNKDSVNHQIVADDKKFDKELDSPVLEPGDAFTTTLGEAGTYNYHCLLHPTMKGSIVVE